MTQDPTGTERRRHPRHKIRNGIVVELRVEVSGDKPAILLTRGQVANISCGGLKCDIDLEVPVGTRVDVSFPDADGAEVTPDLVDGRIVRTESLGGVPDQVAIAFAKPLESLDERLLQPEPTTINGGRSAFARRASWADEPHSHPTFATGTLL